MKHFILETERLQIIPLKHFQLINYLKVDGSLEEQLNVHFIQRKIEPQLIVAFEKFILPSVGNPSKNYLFSTLWTIISKKDRLMVGDFAFKGEPDQNGEVEIGYRTFIQFQNKGYMTEAVRAICRWALDQPGIINIKAEMDKVNPASKRVLEKAGFSKSEATDGKPIWYMKKPAEIALETD